MSDPFFATYSAPISLIIGLIALLWGLSALIQGKIEKAKICILVGCIGIGVCFLIKAIT